MDPHQFINNLNKYGSEGGFQPGLSRMEALLAPCSHPEKNLPVIHVAGTNGKGSTITLLKSVYQQAGYRVGVYISPHLLRFNERITINDQMITDDELKELVEEIAPVVDTISSTDSPGMPSYFEVVTAMALIYFSRQNVDLVLLEVGLGGRLDATNVVKSPLASVITTISLEHTSLLGDNLADIAREKAGIIKSGTPVYTAVEQEEPLQVIKKISSDKKAELIQIEEEYNYQIDNSDLTGQLFTVDNGNRTFQLKTGLLGSYQIKNTLLALAVIKGLQDKYPVSKDDISKGFEQAYWPGRLEVVERDPFVILDGAHNNDAIDNLIRFLNSEFGNKDIKKINILLAVLEDKDIEGMLNSLLEIKTKLNLIITEANNKRALNKKRIIEVAEKLDIEYTTYPDIRNSIKSIIPKLSKEEVLCITGSLYTISEAKRVLAEQV